MPTTRRSFLSHALAGAFAAGAAPLFLRADDKAGVKPLVTGRDAHRYEVLDGWAQLPANYKFGNTHAVMEAADGRILVHHQKGDPDSVAVFDPDGKFIKSWGAEYRAGAHGMQLRKEAGGEFLYLATTGLHTVVKTDLDGKVVFTLDYPKDAKNAKGELCYQEGKDAKTGKAKPANAGYVPTNIAFHPTDGSFYVADGYGQSYVHHYSAAGEYLATFGGKGTGDGQLNVPHGIWCDTRDTAGGPKIVVADRSNERLSYFDLAGKFLKAVKPAAAAYRNPCHFDQRGEYLLVPGLHGVVSVLDRDDKVYTYLGDNPDAAARGKNAYPKDKLIPGVFVAPHGAIWAKSGDAYVAEWLPYGRVTKLRHLA
ncbi:MAG: repeat containing protein [Phycisphaerales bacterium]|nr:repeat containing protein [Phycisphaerales bacterium]